MASGQDKDCEIIIHSAPFSISMAKNCLDSSSTPVAHYQADMQHLCCISCSFKDRTALKNTTLLQKVGTEVIATFILIFLGAGAGMTNTLAHDRITLFGVAAANGLAVMMMIYATGHISGAHMNPAVTISFATMRHFPWCQVPAYVMAQLIGAISASFVLRNVLGNVDNLSATIPSGSALQSFVLELIISFILMFVVSAVSTDTNAIGELAGLAVGGTVALNSIIAGPISGASMNPARSLGPAIAANNFTHIWIYLVSPVLGTLAGAWFYNLIRLVESEENENLMPSARKGSNLKRNDFV